MRFLVIVALLGCTHPPPPAAPVAPPPKPAEPSEPVGLPLGYVEMRLEKVLDIDSQSGLILVDERDNYALLVVVGGTEAMSIYTRMHGEKAPRPLTHDLLDHVLAKLHASLVQVQIDELRGTTFIGSIYLKLEGGRVIKLDSRPSDGIALAIGAHVPIYVKRTVLEQAGLPWDQVQKQMSQAQGNEG